MRTKREPPKPTAKQVKLVAGYMRAIAAAFKAYLVSKLSKPNQPRGRFGRQYPRCNAFVATFCHRRFANNVPDSSLIVASKRSISFRSRSTRQSCVCAERYCSPPTRPPDFAVARIQNSHTPTTAMACPLARASAATIAGRRNADASLCSPLLAPKAKEQPWHSVPRLHQSPGDTQRAVGGSRLLCSPNWKLGRTSRTVATLHLWKDSTVRSPVGNVTERKGDTTR